MTFSTKHPEINTERLIEFNAEGGNFSACFIGWGREKRIFFYGDEFDQFYFFVKDIFPSEINPKYAIDVTYATDNQLIPHQYFISSGREKIIENNITYLFNNKDSLDLTTSANEKDLPEVVKFSWRIAK